MRLPIDFLRLDVLNEASCRPHHWATGRSSGAGILRIHQFYAAAFEPPMSRVANPKPLDAAIAAINPSGPSKGRRTEIEFLNGFVVREGERAGIHARANERLVDIVKKVERGELQQDRRHIAELRLN